MIKRFLITVVGFTLIGSLIGLLLSAVFIFITWEVPRDLVPFLMVIRVFAASGFIAGIVAHCFEEKDVNI